jgi:hypothetical protein
MRSKRPRALLLQNSTNFWRQFGESFLDNFGICLVQGHAKHQWDSIPGDCPAAFVGHGVPFCRAPPRAACVVHKGDASHYFRLRATVS